jgi:hypothetical protein
MSFWDEYAKDQEMNVGHPLGSRCRHCGFINEPDENYVICVPRDMRCEDCGLSIPHPPAMIAPDVDPLEQVNRHFEPLVWREEITSV